VSGTTAAPGGIQWSVAFQMPYDPLRGVREQIHDHLREDNDLTWPILIPALPPG
jgi:hypothetical protein